MKFQVWHNNLPTFSRPFSMFNADNFEHVADVFDSLCDSLDGVYHKTNHLQKDWTTNSGVTPMNGRTGQNTRSTSVGDVVVDESGTAWYCDIVGWEKADFPITKVIDKEISKDVVSDLIALIAQFNGNERNVLMEVLDGCVHEAYSSQAARVNNDGLKAQLEFLVSELGTETLTKTIKEIGHIKG